MSDQTDPHSSPDPRAEIISAYTATAAMPDDTGHFPTDHPVGGRFMPEALMAALDELTEAYETSKNDPPFTPSSPTSSALRQPPQPAHRGARLPSTPAALASCSSART